MARCLFTHQPAHKENDLIMDEIKFNKNEATKLLDAWDTAKQVRDENLVLAGFPYKLLKKVHDAGGFKQAVELCKKQWLMLA